ncbi:hypothetical protein MTR62_17775 [Novosphingobium sp. 1949]|uniref:Uncharacterized protein n=1 Tax=Novosphingobium organovorum TaxID=2930092 RepID=A0ABT0BHI1_9SPHN|nr:hypothetical protein [Novosphingobium organovorum]MCJ2184525.1 hypothetical protein [Novosphingobium organovorum]
MANADTVVDEIHEGTLRPRTHKVVRALHWHMRLVETVQQRALVAFDRGEQNTQGLALQSEMWAMMKPLPIDQQSGLRLSNCLARPDEEVDWHLAEYLTLWARQQGISEQQIIDAFHVE